MVSQIQFILSDRTVAYLLKESTVEAEKQPLLGNARTTQLQELSRYEIWRVQPLLWSELVST